MKLRIAHYRPLLLSATAVLLVACINAPPETRRTSGDEIRFVSRSGIARASGIFHDWQVVDAKIDSNDAAASFVEIEIDVASIDTGFDRRDDHLRDPDFFDTTSWPRARVRVSEARPKGDAPGHYRARFDVQIRDRNESIEGDFSVVSERPLVVEGKLDLDRTLFEVGSPDAWWNPMSPRNEVPVHFRVTLPPAP